MIRYEIVLASDDDGGDDDNDYDDTYKDEDMLL